MSLRESQLARARVRARLKRNRTHAPRRLTLAALALALTALALTPARVLAAQSPPHWTLVAESWPSALRAGDPADRYVLTLTNTGAGPTDGSVVRIKDSLPPGLHASAIEGETGSGEPLECSVGALRCTTSRTLGPFEYATVRITLSVSGPPGEAGPDIADLTGGGAPSASTSNPVLISPPGAPPAPFGAPLFALEALEAGGEPATQAGTHPFALVTSVGLGVGAIEEGLPALGADDRDLEVALPPGLLANASALPRCAQASFQSEGASNCPPDAQVGSIRLFPFGAREPGRPAAPLTVPVYNLAAPPGHLGELGFTIRSIFHVPLFLDLHEESSLAGAGRYRLAATLPNLPEGLPIRAATLLLWGLPADPLHDPL
ncbi:MAG TPA: hypothetical protein VGX16_03175, partial [Solirubrobacteraceae bacterium]|nr:hypothetical protein [Solirubrobacteraceae bacterium]